MRYLPVTLLTMQSTCVTCPLLLRDDTRDTPGGLDATTVTWQRSRKELHE